MDTRRRMIRLAIAAVLGMAGAAQAATLAADSLLCETPAGLEFVSRQDHLKGRSAVEVMKRADASVQGYRLQAEIARTVSMPRQASAEQAKIDAEPYANLVGTCAASGGRTSAEVVERKAISGFVKVRTTFKGQPAELWTYAASLTE